MRAFRMFLGVARYIRMHHWLRYRASANVLEEMMECEVKSSCAFLKSWSKAERRMILKLRGGKVEGACHWLLQCCAWNYCRQPLLEAMGNVEEDHQQKTMETEQPLYYHMHVGLPYSLSLCGQLGSSNHSALFILTNNLLLTLYYWP